MLGEQAQTSEAGPEGPWAWSGGSGCSGRPRVIPHPLQPPAGASGARSAGNDPLLEQSGWVVHPGIPTRITHLVPTQACTQDPYPHPYTRRTLRCSHGRYSVSGPVVGEPRGIRTHRYNPPQTPIWRVIPPLTGLHGRYDWFYDCFLEVLLRFPEVLLRFY